jgi:hypothetical protein
VNGSVGDRVTHNFVERNHIILKFYTERLTETAHQLVESHFFENLRRA